MDTPESNLICPGFRAAAVAAGIKKTPEADLALIINDAPVGAAALFTENRVKAAPVLLSIERMGKTTPRAILLNSGNANACTGPEGDRDTRDLTGLCAGRLSIPEESVIAASTGVIGQRLPADRITRSLEALVSGLSPTGFLGAAHAIMTTDTRPKCAKRCFSADGRTYTILGIAKGAGMIFPHLATMLCVVVTDLPMESGGLDGALRQAAQPSFNAITVDGDMSTNDMILLMSGGDKTHKVDAGSARLFGQQLTELLVELATGLVRDAEGATKFVTITIKGAPTEEVARRVAFQVANSPLVKTTFFGEDPNWGRIMGAIGSVPGDFDPARADISFGDVEVVTGGIGRGVRYEEKAKEIMRGREFAVVVDLNAGVSSFTAYTSDLSIGYVKINADYRS